MVGAAVAFDQVAGHLVQAIPILWKPPPNLRRSSASLELPSLRTSIRLSIDGHGDGSAAARARARGDALAIKDCNSSELRVSRRLRSYGLLPAAEFPCG